MKKTINMLALLALILGTIFTSCVSGKKFRASQAKVDQLQKDSAITQNRLTVCNARVRNLKDDKVSLQDNNDSLQNDNASLKDDNTSLQTENELVQNDFDQLSTTTEMTIADQGKRLKNLQNIVQAQKDLMSKLKNSISEALMNYKMDELYVYTKDGSVYISMEEKLLFLSGSDVVDLKGKEALKSLVKVLNNTKEITVMVEGHTDNVPIKTKQFEDNWDLSTARATSILRIMTSDYGFDSNRITASGKGKFHPVKTNDTPEGRASNRRTEIILSPDLNELFSLLN